MKKSIFLLFVLCITALLQAQVYKTVNCTAGHLSDSLNTDDRNTVTDLTLTGTIDARDFKTMRDSMTALAVLDADGAAIAAYTGTLGTAGTSSIVYAANAVPNNAFYSAGYNLTLTSVILPSTVNYIGASAFSYCKVLASVSLPSSVTAIGNSAFCYCEVLSSITFPTLLNSIGNFSFGQCTGLTSINIPSSVTSIQDLAFYECHGLTSPTITISSSLTSIGTRAFAGCNGSLSVDAGNPNYSSVDGVLFNKIKTSVLQCLTAQTGSYSIPSTVNTIETYAFYECGNLSEIVIPSTVASINSFAFSDCNGLDSTQIPSTVLSIGYKAFNRSSGYILVDPGNPNYSSADGILFNKTKTLLIACPISKTGSYTIPSSVTTIGDFAFENCFGLTSISIPASDTSIAGYAFFNCQGLKSINANKPVPVSLSASNEVFFAVDPAICTLYVPSGSLSAYEAANQWMDFTHIIEGNGFWLSDTLISIAADDGSNATIEMHSNCNWTANSDETWLSVSPDADSGDITINFTAEANLVVSTRQATVTVSAPGTTSKTITVTQDAAEVNGLTAGLTEPLCVYPNPVKDILNLKNFTGIKQIEICNIEGQVIVNLNIITSGINVSNLARGVYLCYITTESGTWIKKIIKE
jgi:hypothetical protein